VLRTFVLALCLGPAFEAAALAQERPDPSLRLLTRIEDVRALSLDEGARGYPVRLRGTVTYFNETALHGLIVHDGSFGQYVEDPLRREDIPAWKELKRGDVVEIEGYTMRGGFAPNVRPEALRRLGQGPLPRARGVPYSALITGRHDCDFVEIEGVVERTFLSEPRLRTLFADVAIEGGTVRASFWDFAPEDLTRFVDARVRLRTNVGALFGQSEQLRGVSLLSSRTSDLEVLDPPPDPFALPIRPIRGIYKYSLAGEVNRRIRIRGVVIGQIVGRPVGIPDFTTASTLRHLRHVLYVSDGVSGARVETEQPETVSQGTVIEVAGFPAVTPGNPILKNAVFRVVGKAAAPPPAKLSSRDLLTPEHDAQLVRVEGQLLGVVSRATERVLVLKAGANVFDAGLDAARGGVHFEDFRPGSLVAATGVYAYQHGPLPSFRLLLRAPEDVVIVAAAPWWTLRHTAVTVGVVALLSCIAAFWVSTIANRKRQQYQAILTERGRLARELHDTLEQGLAGITLQLEAVAGSLEASPQAARQTLDVARQMLRYSLEEARRSVMDLRSQALETRDLPGAITELAERMTLGTPVRAEVRVTGVPRRLDGSQEHHLLRIGLEALTNAMKHAEARVVRIELRYAPEATELEVNDDGRGFRPDVCDGLGAHFGLEGIRERVDKLGGTLAIDARPGGGTRVHVRVPWVSTRALAAEAEAPPLRVDAAPEPAPSAAELPSERPGRA
jgi:signal transduction histidine kinase